MILFVTGLRIAVILPFAMALALAGCGKEDKRLTDDKQSCHSMGHLAGSAGFNKCMEDLNERRCATVNRNEGGGHFTTLACTKL